MPTRTFRAWADAVPAARAFVAETLANVPPQLCQTAALLVSELATNAVRHSGTHEFTVRLEHDLSGGRLWIGVSDTGPGQPVIRHPLATDERTPGKGNLGTLPDTDQVVPLSPEQAAAHLRQAVERILAESRGYRQQSSRTLSRDVLDW